MSAKADQDKITIRSVEIEIGGTKIKLTLEQVEELKKILAKAFPEPEIKTVYVTGTERARDRFYHMQPAQWHQSPATPQRNEWRATFRAQAETLRLVTATT